jgi:hypothetical protein
MNDFRHKATLDIPSHVIEKWQSILDIAAELMHVPTALIMRLNQSNIEVLLASHSEGNPYKPGDHEYFEDSGLYCETVIKTREKLLVGNALTDAHWCDNPDVKLKMISYLGFPLVLPDHSPFGTICVLDNKENHYTGTYEALLLNFRDIIQAQLELLYMNAELGEKNRSLTDYISELKVLRGIVPICGFCKKIRDDVGEWHQMENYISDHSDAEFSHGLCPDCAQKYYGDVLSARKDR